MAANFPLASDSHAVWPSPIAAARPARIGPLRVRRLDRGLSAFAAGAATLAIWQAARIVDGLAYGGAMAVTPFAEVAWTVGAPVVVPVAVLVSLAVYGVLGTGFVMVRRTGRAMQRRHVTRAAAICFALGAVAQAGNDMTAANGGGAASLPAGAVAAAWILPLLGIALTLVFVGRVADAFGSPAWRANARGGACAAAVVALAVAGTAGLGGLPAERLPTAPLAAQLLAATTAALAFVVVCWIVASLHLMRHDFRRRGRQAAAKAVAGRLGA